MNYVPNPVDTSEVVFSEEISEVLEEIAKNTHEIWASSKISEGWKYGEHYNDTEKTHPCLVPYELLPESEKDYDRNTSGQTIRYLLKSGFTISKAK